MLVIFYSFIIHWVDFIEFDFKIMNKFVLALPLMEAWGVARR